jgi:hypothetical protein
MGLRLKGEYAHYTGFVIGDPGVFFFVDGKEEIYWDTSDDNHALSIATAMLLFQQYGHEEVVAYIYGRPTRELQEPRL